MSYAWPGNVRELRNLVEQAVLLERSERLEPELINRLLIDRPQRLSPMPTPIAEIARFIGRDDQAGSYALPRPAPVVPIAVGTKVEEAERQLALRTLEAYAGDRVAACAALGVDSARLEELHQQLPVTALASPQLELFFTLGPVSRDNRAMHEADAHDFRSRGRAGWGWPEFRKVRSAWR